MKLNSQLDHTQPAKKNIYTIIIIGNKRKKIYLQNEKQTKKKQPAENPNRAFIYFQIGYCSKSKMESKTMNVKKFKKIYVKRKSHKKSYEIYIK